MDNGGDFPVFGGWSPFPRGGGSGGGRPPGMPSGGIYVPAMRRREEKKEELKVEAPSPTSSPINVDVTIRPKFQLPAKFDQLVVEQLSSTLRICSNIPAHAAEAAERIRTSIKENPIRWESKLEYKWEYDSKVDEWTVVVVQISAIPEWIEMRRRLVSELKLQDCKTDPLAEGRTSFPNVLVARVRPRRLETPEAVQEAFRKVVCEGDRFLFGDALLDTRDSSICKDTRVLRVRQEVDQGAWNLLPKGIVSGSFKSPTLDIVEVDCETGAGRLDRFYRQFFLGRKLPSKIINDIILPQVLLAPVKFDPKMIGRLRGALSVTALMRTTTLLPAKSSLPRRLQMCLEGQFGEQGLCKKNFEGSLLFDDPRIKAVAAYRIAAACDFQMQTYCLALYGLFSFTSPSAAKCQGLHLGASLKLAFDPCERLFLIHDLMTMSDSLSHNVKVALRVVDIIFGDDPPTGKDDKKVYSQEPVQMATLSSATNGVIAQAPASQALDKFRSMTPPECTLLGLDRASNAWIKMDKEAFGLDRRGDPIVAYWLQSRGVLSGGQIRQ